MKYKNIIIILTFMTIIIPINSNAQKGCCSWHGGVSHCGENGYYICNDGTQSPTCGCDISTTKTTTTTTTTTTTVYTFDNETTNEYDNNNESKKNIVIASFGSIIAIISSLYYRFYKWQNNI